MTGRDLKALRQSEQVSQQSLADYLGRSQQAISAIERRSEIRQATVDRHLRAIAELAALRGKA